MLLAFRFILGTLFQVLSNFVHPLELPWPLVVVQELAVVEPVVISGVVLGMVRRREGCCLVAIHGIVPADVTHALSNAIQQKERGR